MSIDLSGRDIDDVRIDWESVFRQYASAVRGLVSSRVPAAGVDDAVQDTFERAYRSRHRFDPDRPVWPWLATIAKRACIEARRTLPTEMLVDLSTERLVSGDDVHRELERSLRAIAIAQALERMSPRHRRLFIGWEIEGRPFDRLAAQEGLSPQALKSALCRARHGFRVSYTSISERVGLAAFAFGRLLGRLRERVHLLPPAEVVMGGVVIGVAAAAVFVGTPPAQSDANRAMLAAAGAPLVERAPALDLPPLPPSVDRRVGTAPLPSATGSRPPAAPDDGLGPSTGGGAGVKVAPAGPQATFSVTWEEDRVRGRARATVTVDCRGGAWELACTVVRSLPGGS